MLKIFKTKFEYEAVELLKSEEDFKNKNLKLIDVDLSPLVKDLAETASLFGDRDCYFVKCEKEVAFGILNKDLLEACAKSEHLFLFWGKSAEFKKIITELGLELVEKKEVVAEFFPKDLVSAIQSLDKKKTWICLRKELVTKSGEEVYGVINWALKQMVTVQNMEKFDAKSGVKDFQYRNLKKSLSAQDPSKIQKIYFDFVNSYNTSRAKSIDLSSALEMWVLGW